MGILWPKHNKWICAESAKSIVGRLIVILWPKHNKWICAESAKSIVGGFEGILWPEHTKWIYAESAKKEYLPSMHTYAIPVACTAPSIYVVPGSISMSVPVPTVPFRPQRSVGTVSGSNNSSVPI